MPERLNPSAEQEELSLLLDEINAGRQPECTNPETIELLAVAKFIKTANISISPPKHILDQTVDKALESIQVNRKSSRWWYSSALSTAVAICLVVLLNLLPSWQQFQSASPPADSPPPNVRTSKQKTTLPSPLIPAVTVNQSKPATGDKTTNEQLPKNKPQKSKPAITQNPTTKMPALVEEVKPHMAEKSVPSKAARLPSKPYPATVKSSSPVMTPLIIPGQIPDFVLTDEKNRVLYQIYHKGTSEEIIIIQQFEERNTNHNKLKSPALAKSSDNNLKSVNFIQVKIADQNVTIKARKTRQELHKLAESLK